VTRRPAALILILALLLPAASRALHAQPWLEDGRTCFCLKHETGQIIRNCTGVKAGNDFFPTATCQGNEAGDQPTTLTVRPPWTPIQDGAPGCRPCRGARPTQQVPRGDDE
jgi:hypothetical protein